ncbi:hypothetical protein [Parageobacillus thermoglucosidasius]|uniref:hypothetical protein n=1 Tax=Parageobacillus thermoglucosidasius TaxID=1426 RepID=UPI001E553FC3|nr:hypothetical protein [Parageobacillus thermoglucosidasius]
MCRPHGANAVFLGRRGSFHRRAKSGKPTASLDGFPQRLEPGGRFLNDIVDASLTDGSVQPFLEQLNKPGRKKELHRMEVGDQRTDALPYWTWCVTSGGNSACSSRPQQGHDFTSASC